MALHIHDPELPGSAISRTWPSPGHTPQGSRKVSTMAILVFVVVAVLWVAFGTALVRKTAWTARRARSVPRRCRCRSSRASFCCLGGGPAACETSWARWLRLLLVAGLAWATIYTFLPWRNGDSCA